MATVQSMETRITTGVLQPAAQNRAILRFLPWVLATFAFFMALRGVNNTDVIDTDAARHIMNGAFVHDMLRDHAYTNPIQYGKSYYSRLPALSLPYHPPMFPAIEAVFFGLFGLNLFAARLAVALAVGIAIFLITRLILYLTDSPLLAACAVTTFFAWRFAQFVASDVMLEFPSLAFAAVALWLLRDLDTRYSWANSLGFALFAAAAVWTKQHAVFLGLVPFAYILFTRRWRLLRSLPLWISSIVFGIAVIALTTLSLPFRGAGVDQVSPVNEIWEIFSWNSRFYLNSVINMVGLIPTIVIPLVVLPAAIFCRRPRTERPQLPLFAAWTSSAFLVLLLIGPYDPRYLFFVFPGLIVIIYVSLHRLAARVTPRYAWTAPAIVALLCLAAGLRIPAPFLHGPSEAANLAMQRHPARVLYCGSLDGNFMFTVRRLDPSLRTIVVTGEKVPEADRSPRGFEAFAHRYGIESVVIERTGRAQACDALEQAPTRSMVLEQKVPLTSSLPRWQGHLSVFRFTNPSPHPDSTLKMDVPKIGTSVQANF